MRPFGGRRDRPDPENILLRRVAVVVIAQNCCAYHDQRDAEDEDGFHDALTAGPASDDESNVAMRRTTFTPKTLSAPYGPAHRIINFAVFTTAMQAHFLPAYLRAFAPPLTHGGRGIGKPLGR